MQNELQAGSQIRGRQPPHTATASKTGGVTTRHAGHLKEIFNFHHELRVSDDRRGGIEGSDSNLNQGKVTRAGWVVFNRNLRKPLETSRLVDCGKCPA
eukprot:6186440-Pleurochrysis_carterae.AAC.3